MAFCGQLFEELQTLAACTDERDPRGTLTMPLDTEGFLSSFPFFIVSEPLALMLVVFEVSSLFDVKIIRVFLVLDLEGKVSPQFFSKISFSLHAVGKKLLDQLKW